MACRGLLPGLRVSAGVLSVAEAGLMMLVVNGCCRGAGVGAWLWRAGWSGGEVAVAFAGAGSGACVVFLPLFPGG